GSQMRKLEPRPTWLSTSTLPRRFQRQGCHLGALAFVEPARSVCAAGERREKALFTPTPTPRVHIDIGSSIGGPGDAVAVAVLLTPSGANVVATSNDVTFDPEVFALDLGTCRLSGARDNTIVTTFVGVSTLRAFVEPGSSRASLPAGVLYICTFRIAASAIRTDRTAEDLPGPHTPPNSNARAFDAAGNSLAVVAADGSIVVSLVVRSCSGDCSGDRHVTVDELVTGVNIALGNSTVTTCLQFDTNADGKVTVDELVTAVNRALDGC
ncbi:MAG TPA: hypothetical protein VL403_18345, partial [Candidatus Kryptonia bacterium]|nr:hypothetical protein [Candidatus Kryptonia bacterium]